MTTPVLARGIVGVPSLADGSEREFRVDKNGAVVVSQRGGRYGEATRRGSRYFAANQSATAFSVALNTTYTGIVLSNPAGSAHDLVVDKVALALSVAPAAIACIGVFSGYVAAGITAHTTPLAPQGCYVGNSAGVGLADAAATLVGTPRWTTMLYNGFTAGALPGGNYVYADLEGSLVIPPGGYAGIGALTAVTGLGSISWEEVLRATS